MQRLAQLTLACRIAAWLLAVAATLGNALAQGEDESSNVYAAGADVRIETPVNGDLYAAAGRVSVLQAVYGDAVIAAGSIDIAGAIRDDLRAAGGVVTLGGNIAGEALVAGGSIAFGRDAEVLGRVSLAGGDVAVAGKLRNGLKAYAKNIVILGEIAGPVELHGEHLEITASARIFGEVHYSSPNQIHIDPKAQVSGRVIRKDATLDIPHPKFEIPGLPIIRPMLLLGLLAAGALLLALFPRFTAHALQTLGKAPLKSVGLGTAIFFSGPPVMLLLILTIIGIPIALLMAAVYGAAILIGYLITALYIAERLLRAVRHEAESRLSWRLAGLAVALILLWLVYAIPYAGTVIILIALFAGLGAMVLQAFSSYSAKA